MEVARRSNKHVSFDPAFLEKEEKRKLEKKELLKIADRLQKQKCQELFDRLTDTAYRASLQQNIQDDFVFAALVVRILDGVQVPANISTVARVYSMTAQQRADFDNHYNNRQFFVSITVLLTLVENNDNSSPFFPTVTPESTPDSSPHGTPRRDGNGGNPGGGGGGVGAAAPPPAV